MENTRELCPRGENEREESPGVRVEGGGWGGGGGVVEAL